ncbi:MAG: type II toxin-antitoxin system HicB family antitoxin [Methanomicrobiales archaeon]|nr:type II toxin-antitoxin system HicB family antitoxin [Methanomicrobiales archaeon]
MNTLIRVYRDGEWFVAVDLKTDVVDQGKTKDEAISRLKTGLAEHIAVLHEMTEKDPTS